MQSNFRSIWKFNNSAQW